MRAIINFVKIMFDDMNERDLGGHASMISYTTIFSVFPLLFFVASVLGIVASKYNLYERLLIAAKDYIPADAYNVIITNAMNILPTGSLPLLIFSLLLALYSASNIVNVTVKVLNEVNGIGDSRSIFRKLFYSISFLLIFIITAILAILPIVGEVYVRNIVPPFPGRVLLFGLIEALIYFFPFIMVITFFYKKALNCDLGFRDMLPGAVFFVIVFIIFSQIFRLMVVFMNVNKTYGAIGGVILFLLWVQYNALFFLLGSRLNMLLMNRNKKAETNV